MCGVLYDIVSVILPGQTHLYLPPPSRRRLYFSSSSTSSSSPSSSSCQIFTVVLSIVTKGHLLPPQGWAGLAVAFLGIMGELQHKYAKHAAKAAAKAKGNKSKKSSNKVA